MSGVGYPKLSGMDSSSTADADRTISFEVIAEADEEDENPPASKLKHQINKVWRARFNVLLFMGTDFVDGRFISSKGLVLDFNSSKRMPKIQALRVKIYIMFKNIIL